ncbi:MAG: CRISPR-associated protein Cas1 [uncultured Thiotrichaceae bacterium]|uniref:CRISPR-associated endonuclease Cas1 n=1 Tax=uncultured Thiotrichaceae bacterium TaxID=298394 RepID=A0A6S6TM24_9GAMM|nr:MAG: CRISPR-associated protein Cas1 [uncultured Thiotrichaceae bacterium]
MSTLYIDRKDTQLSIEGKTLVCYIKTERQRPVPLALLERVVLASNVQLSSQVIGKLAAQGIALSLINMRQPQNRATLISTSSKNPAIRQLQYQATTDSNVKAEIARQLIQGKIQNHARFLDHLSIEFPAHRHPLQKASRALNKALQQLSEKKTTVDSLRGIEGNAARHVFQAYTHIFPASLHFTGRKRRPPPDPVNATLSLAYTLLHNRAIQLIYAAGLDPMLGFLHENQYSRDSLAADLIEPWRPHIDRWVWEWFNERYLREDHFSEKNGGCLLGKRGRAKFYAAFETRMKPLQRAMRWQILALKKGLLEYYE